jgi:hypothetical protein
MPRRIDAGELVAALGGLLVIVALFLDWYGPADGWSAFEALDLLIAALALCAIAVAASSFGAGWPLGPRTLLPVGLLLLVVIAVQLADPPPAVPDGEQLQTGAWLALAGAALVLVGGILRTASISVTVDVGGRDTRRRVSAVDRRREAAAAAAPRRAVFDAEAARPAGGTGPEAGAPGAPAAGADAARRRERPTGDGDPEATQRFSALDEER